MKPKDYWQSLSAQEKDKLASRLDKSKAFLANIFHGLQYASLSLAVEIANECDGHIIPIDLVSPENRKAIKSIKSA